MTKDEARFIRICTVLALDEKTREELRPMIESLMKVHNDYVTIEKVKLNYLGPSYQEEFQARMKL